MEIFSFFGETQVYVLLIPAIIVLVVALVVINKHKKVEAVIPDPQIPVTTTPTPPNPSEVVQQAIPQQAQPQATQASAAPATPAPVVAQVVQSTPVVKEAVTPVLAQAEVVPQAATAPEQNTTSVPDQQVIQTASQETVPAWRPEPQATVTEEKPFVEEPVTVTVAPEATMVQSEVVEQVANPAQAVA